MVEEAGIETRAIQGIITTVTMEVGGAHSFAIVVGGSTPKMLLFMPTQVKGCPCTNKHIEGKIHTKRHNGINPANPFCDAHVQEPKFIFPH
jgi:hypothetical protein